MNKAYSIILNEEICPEETTNYDSCKVTPKVLPKINIVAKIVLTLVILQHALKELKTNINLKKSTIK